MSSDDHGVNEDIISAWNTVLFEKFLRFRHVVTLGLSVHGDETMRRHAPRAGARVLDVGCGFGDSTLQLAKLVGPSGQAVGIDGAARFIEAAREEARKAQLDNVEFVVGDVQSCELVGDGAPYELAFARFGTMFFTSPVAALRNVRRSLAPDGKLAMVVWRKREDNLWLHVAEQCVHEIVPKQEPVDAVTCGPGPFSMSGPDMVSDQLIAAGFSQITFERYDREIGIGRDLDDAVEFAMALGPAGEAMRLAGAEAEKRRPEVMAALRKAFAAFSHSDGVRAPSSTWIISARPA